MLKKTLAIVLCAAVTASGCASVAGPRYARTQSPAAARPADAATVMADYVQKIPMGTRVRIDRTTGGTIKGTLMKATADSVTVQRNTRLPEAPIDVPIAQITRVTVDAGNGGLGRAIAIGAGVGVGATLGFLFLLASLISD